MTEDATRRFIAWGDNTLARRLVRELMTSYGAEVTAVLPAPPLEEDDEGEPGPTVLVAARLSAEVLRRAGLAEAAAVALVDQDDVANVDAALIAREVNPDVRIVLRMFTPVLGECVACYPGRRSPLPRSWPQRARDAPGRRGCGRRRAGPHLRDGGGSAELHTFGVEVVAVDKAPDARGVQVARELGIPLIIANADSPETLRAASWPLAGPSSWCPPTT